MTMCSTSFFMDDKPLQGSLERTRGSTQDASYIRIATINIQNVTSNMVCLIDLLGEHDVVCVQEHWQYEFEAASVNDISRSHNCFVKCVDSNNLIDPSRRPRGHGGVAIYWPSTWDSKVTKQPDKW